MRKISLHLPLGRRLDLNLVKVRKGPSAEVLLPDIKSLLKIRKGSLISRLFSKIFEKRKFRKILGQSFIAFLAATPLIPQPLQAYKENTAPLTVIESPIITNTETGTRYPVNRVAITQNYGFFHPGIDFDGLTGDPIYPITAGKVEKTEYSRFGYGNSVLIDHGNGVKSMYAHLSKINVSENDVITNETVIGLMGATGRSFGDHLHLEVYENGKAINPLILLSN